MAPVDLAGDLAGDLTSDLTSIWLGNGVIDEILTNCGLLDDRNRRSVHLRTSGEKPLPSNPAFDPAANRTAALAPLVAGRRQPEPVRRISPRLSALVVVLLSLGTWAAIGAVVVALLPK
ncbi:MAG TPA: hypothetical protein VMF05_06925 [Stellaceae bacterium]|nr:hypothetical protein [Stellaceae bacterium]